MLPSSSASVAMLGGYGRRLQERWFDPHADPELPDRLVDVVVDENADLGVNGPSVEVSTQAYAQVDGEGAVLRQAREQRRPVACPHRANIQAAAPFGRRSCRTEAPIRFSGPRRTDVGTNEPCGRPRDR